MEDLNTNVFNIMHRYFDSGLTVTNTNSELNSLPALQLQDTILGYCEVRGLLTQKSYLTILKVSPYDTFFLVILFGFFHAMLNVNKLYLTNDGAKP